MHNTSLTLLKWIFIAVGLGLLVIAIVVPNEAKWLLTLLGLMFTGVGGGILFVGERNAKRAAWLLQHGQRTRSSSTPRSRSTAGIPTAPSSRRAPASGASCGSSAAPTSGSIPRGT